MNPAMLLLAPLLALLSGAGALAPEGEVALSIDLTKFQVRGQAAAPVLVAEFSDFRCPACEKFSLTIMPNLAKEFIEPGKAKVVFVDFPMMGDADYTALFEAVHCAGRQGKYWAYHDALWEHVGMFSDDQILDYARQLGLALPAFQQCLASDEFRQRVLDNARFGNKLGLGARPTFFIGRRQPGGGYKGRYIVGAHNYIVFKSMIDRMLASGDPRGGAR